MKQGRGTLDAKSNNMITGSGRGRGLCCRLPRWFRDPKKERPFFVKRENLREGEKCSFDSAKV